MVHPGMDSNHSFSEQEVQMSRQDTVGTNPVVPDGDHGSEQENFSVRGHDQNNRSAEIQN